MYHPEVADAVSFVILDNHPEGAAAIDLKGLDERVPHLRYVPFRGYRSTAARDLIFREADADVVCCLDSHVLLKPGALGALLEYFEENPTSRDMIQGPLLSDDLVQRGGDALRAHLERRDVRAVGHRPAPRRRRGRAVRDPHARSGSVRLPARGLAGHQLPLPGFRGRGGIPAREGSPGRGPRALPSGDGVGAPLHPAEWPAVPTHLGGPGAQLPDRLGRDRLGHRADGGPFPRDAGCHPRSGSRRHPQSDGSTARQPVHLLRRHRLPQFRR